MKIVKTFPIVLALLLKSTAAWCDENVPVESTERSNNALALGVLIGFDSIDEVESLSVDTDGTVTVKDLDDGKNMLFFNRIFPVSGCFGIENCESGPYGALLVDFKQGNIFGGWSAGWMLRGKNFGIGIGYAARQDVKYRYNDPVSQVPELRKDDFDGAVLMISYSR